ncbi:MAG: endonuclease MutS2 [Planctomycetota bacterium]
MFLPFDDPFSLGALEFEVVRERVASLALTGLGRGRARNIAPFRLPAETRDHLQKTTEAILLTKTGRAPAFGAAEDVRDLVRHLSGGGRPLEPKDVARIANSVRRGMDIKKHLLNLIKDAPLLGSLAAAIPDLTELCDEIDRSIDPRGEIYENASVKLSEAHAKRRAAEAEVERVLHHVLSRAEVRKSLNSLKPIYRNYRPALAVRSEFRGRVPGLLLDRSSTGSTVYIEPEEVVEIGNELAEISVVIAREVSLILLELSKTLLSRGELILRSQEFLADLEIEFTKARFAELFHCCIPEITKNRKLKISGARHPKLLERSLEEAGKVVLHDIVPIDMEIGGEYDLFVITGPNTGGKTVALKTVGLLSAMALSGLPVPARHAEIPGFDAIFVDIGDEQEISQSLSTFSSHMVRVAHSIKYATRESLVLVDEVGAGTDPAEGAALGEAILEYYLSRGIRTIATTHLGKLKELAYKHSRAENGTVEFDPDTLQPKYRIIVGMPGSSQALAVAKRVGIPASILENAHLGIERKDQHHDAVIAAIQNARIEADAARKRADDLEHSADQKRLQIEEHERAVEQRSAALAAEAQRQVDESLTKLRVLLKEQFETLIAGAPKPFDTKLRDLRTELETAITTDPIEQKRAQFVDRLKRDAIVYVPKFRRRCQVRRIQRDRKIVTVMVGDVPTDVRFDELTWYEVL